MSTSPDTCYPRRTRAEDRCRQPSAPATAVTPAGASSKVGEQVVDHSLLLYLDVELTHRRGELGVPDRGDSPAHQPRPARGCGPPVRSGVQAPRPRAEPG